MVSEQSAFWKRWNAEFPGPAGPVEWIRPRDSAERPTPIAAARRAAEARSKAETRYQVEWIPLYPLVVSHVVNSTNSAGGADAGAAGISEGGVGGDGDGGGGGGGGGVDFFERYSERGMATAAADGDLASVDESRLERGAAAPVWLFGLLAQGMGWSAVAPQSVVVMHYLVFGANKRAFMRASGVWHPLASSGGGGGGGGDFKALALSGTGLIDASGAAVFPSRAAFEKTTRLLGIIAAATGRRPVVPRVPCDAPWLPHDDGHFAGLRADGLIDNVAAPCAAPEIFDTRLGSTRGGGGSGEAAWPTSPSPSTDTSSLTRRQHAFAVDGFAAMDQSLLDAPRSGGGGGGVCCYIVPLHRGQCKDADLIHDFELRSALAVHEGRQHLSIATVSLLLGGGGGGGGGGFGDGDGDGDEGATTPLFLRLSADEVAAADVVYLDVAGGGGGGGDPGVRDTWAAALETAARVAERDAPAQFASRVQSFKSACFLSSED
jgi:hypothetical protein